MNRPTKATRAGQAFLALRGEANSAGRATAEYLRLYALEGFLLRLAASPYRDRFVLKGGVLLAAENCVIAVGEPLGLGQADSNNAHGDTSQGANCINAFRQL